MILTGTSRPASDQRRQLFVDAARDAFFTHGYAGTSMSSIAAVVGGSKTTLWTYFPCKLDLFIAVLDDLVEHYGRALAVPLDRGDDLADALTRFGKALLETLHSEPIIAMHRLITGEAGRFPELARLFYERAPRRGKARLAAFLDDAMESGTVRHGDPALAARQFAGLCQCGSPQHRMFGVVGEPTETEMEAEIALAVDTFLRAWAP